MDKTSKNEKNMNRTNGNQRSEFADEISMENSKKAEKTSKTNSKNNQKSNNH